MRSIQLLFFVALESQVLISVLGQGHIGHPVNGTCMRSLYLDLTSTPKGWHPCREYCAAIEGSNFFTYNPGNSFCLCSAHCEEMSTTECPSCISGEIKSDDECLVPNARVHGIFISVDATADAKECAKKCHARRACKWFTYDREHQSCLLTKDKQYMSNCPTCTYGHDHCIQRGTSGFTSLFTCGGQGASTHVDITILPSSEGSHQNRTCNEVPEIPSFKFDNFAMWDDHDKSVLCCGGEPSLQYKRCYKYTGDEWIDLGEILKQQRYHSRAVELSDGRYWISGGAHGGAQKTSEFYKDGRFSNGPRLPTVMYQHCAVEVEPGFVFISGNGHNGRNQAYQFDPETGKFQHLPNMNHQRYDHGCGVVDKGDSYDIVVAGGHYGGYQSHTEIYNTATRKWRQGPTLPQRLSRMSSVQYEDTFLLVGGHNGGQYLDTIYQYNQSSETWILRPERLSAPKCEFGAVLAGPPVGDCP